MMRKALDATTASRFADIALSNVAREYPNKPDHVLGEDGDAKPPRALHPSFYGSYDWHSCVHMHWLLACLQRKFPALPQRADIDAMFDRHLAPESIAAECTYLARPSARSFERTYGWAWLLKLADELAAGTDDRFRGWSRKLSPLARAFVVRYLDYLPKADYPIRYGMHPNSAFGLLFALDYARHAGERELEDLCVVTARRWFGADRDAPSAWEPSGADFLSPALIEAELMRRVLAPPEFPDWLAAFMPGLARGEPATMFTPVAVSDRSDPQIVHLDGLNLSRAWCFDGIAGALPAADPRVSLARAAAAAHLDAGLAGLDDADYLGSHWLASFATLALDP
jgi:hypothetical protein